MRFVLAITGATGSAFGLALLERLTAHEAVEEVFLLLSPTGRQCLAQECGVDAATLASATVRLLDERDLGAAISSGSCLHNGMVILPCSAGTLGRIASGTSDNLVCRAADVCLKERRPLILGLRETPLNRIHLENMLRAHDAGALIMPLMPSFYHRPENMTDLFQAFATRIMDHLGLPERDARRWNGC